MCTFQPLKSLNNLMEKKDFINYWQKASEHDLKVANSLFNSGHFDYCPFLSHLALEKLLKALRNFIHG